MACWEIDRASCCIGQGPEGSPTTAHLAIDVGDHRAGVATLNAVLVDGKTVL
jgi:hypothetical protein